MTNRPRGPRATRAQGPNDGPVRQAQGKTHNVRLMLPSACVDFHAFAETLGEWETGVPVDCGAEWSWDTVVAAVEQGAHKSATSPESIALVAKHIAYQVKAGYATIVPWEEVCQLRPPNLKISPLAVVPQRNQRGRMILDLLFAARQRQRGRKRRQLAQQQLEDTLQPSVNDTTARQAPKGPIKKLGNVLPRLFDFMGTVPP